VTWSNRRPVAAFAGIAVTGLVASVLPTLSPTAASWTAGEWDHAVVGTSSFDCGTDAGYATTATGRFLGGGVLGIDLDSIAGLAPVTATRSGTLSPVALPAGAAHVPGDDNRDTYLNPLDVSALGAIGIDLSGFTVDLPAGSAGAVNQYAQVTNLGYSAAASGLVTDAGGVGVTPATPDDELPEPATIGLGTLLPTTTEVTDVALQLGAVAASSTLDWCAALESSTWGDGSEGGNERQYGIAGLDLATDSPLVTGLVPQAQTAADAVTSAVAGLQGTSGGIAQAITGALTGVGGVLAGLNLGAVSGGVTLTGLDLTPVDGLLTGPGTVLSDGVVTVDLTDPDGTVLVDIAELAGGPDQLNNLAPNTELVINAAVINDVLARVGALVQGWVDDVTDALLAAISGIALHVDLTTAVGISSLGIDILSVHVTLDTDLGELLVPDGTPPAVGVSATALDLGILGAAVATVLATLGLGSLSSLVTGINTSATLPGDLLAAVTSTVTTTLTSLVDDLISDLTAVATQLVTVLGTVLNPLPTVLSVMVNVQPDQPGAPSGYGYTGASPPATSLEYLVTALRIGLLDGVLDEPVYLNLATASVGPNSRLP
jgi:hypothetical protein